MGPVWRTPALPFVRNRSLGRPVGQSRSAAASSVVLMTRVPCSIISSVWGARSFGSRSAVHTNRARCSPSEKICATPLWCLYGPSTIDQASPARVVEVDQHLAHDRAIGEGHDPVVSVAPRVGDEPGCEALVQRTPVAQRGPRVLGARIDDGLFANRSHAIPSGRWSASLSFEMPAVLDVCARLRGCVNAERALPRQSRWCRAR
jgi:hypothetical protein